MRPRHLGLGYSVLPAVLASAIGLGTLAACGSSTTCATSASPLPAVLTVESATGAPIACDATLSFPEGPDGGSPQNTVTPCLASADLGGCPTPPSDGGSVPCAYLVNFGQLKLGSGYPVRVSELGFEPVLLNDVITGVDLCGATYTRPSILTVTLQPVGNPTP